MTLVHKFWNNVFNLPNKLAMRLKEQHADGHVLVEVSMEQYGRAVAAFMSHLRKLGVQRGDRIAILAWNCPEWICMDLAIQTLGGVTVPIYPTTDKAQVNFILENAEAKFTFSNEPKQVAKVTYGSAIHFDQVPAALEGKPVGETSFMNWILPELNCGLYIPCRPGVQDELAAIGKMLSESGEFAGLKADDLATLIYTSGSSGNPKGCMITHGNIVAAMEALSAVIALDPETDFYLSYLPLAHVYERVDGMYMCIWNLIPVGFSPPLEMAQNLPVFKPTMLCGVPAIWEKMRNGLYESKEWYARVLNKLHVWKPLLNFAFARKHGGYAHRFFDRLLFKKVRARLGGRLRILVSGGAPIPESVLQFFSKVGANLAQPELSLEALEGYGATETTGGITTNRPAHGKNAGSAPRNKVGTVGLPVQGCQVRIVKQDGGEESQQGVGEIQLDGPMICKGYWRMPEKTAETFLADGFYKSGDLGFLDEDGFLKIKGRMNGLYKTSQGKYVSSEKVEAAFKPFPLIQYSLPVAHGRKYSTALIWVNAEVAATLVGRSLPAGSEAGEFYAKQPEVLKAVAQAIEEGNKGLEHWEQVGDFRIMSITANAANGILTDTLKLRTKVLLERFKAEIDEMYAHPSRDKKESAGSGWTGKLTGMLKAILNWRPFGRSKS